MTTAELIEQKRISEVVHFTTHSGLMGILHSRLVLSRARLPKEADLEHIYKPNAEIRRDLEWLDYVNLSISKINQKFFDTSCRWHRQSELWWCILAFDPVVLTHAGVVFATTNNMYSGVRRAAEGDGLAQLFRPSIEQWSGKFSTRSNMMSSAHTTCPQAEALYPQALSTENLKTIYTVLDQDADEVHAQLVLTGHERVSVVVDPDRFRASEN